MFRCPVGPFTPLTDTVSGMTETPQFSVAQFAVTRYLVLLRGINVGGKNKVPMAPLRARLEEMGHTDVASYIASGNVILRSDRSAVTIKRAIEEALPKAFRLDSEIDRGEGAHPRPAASGRSRST